MTILCKVCKWEIGDKDHFCPGCGSQLRICTLDRLCELSDGCYQLEICNSGQLSLSWVIESEEEGLTISPDYGEISAYGRVVISLSSPLRSWRLKVYTNDPLRPELDVTGCAC